MNPLAVHSAVFMLLVGMGSAEVRSAPPDPAETPRGAVHPNSSRPGWRRIEGRWVRPAGTLTWDQLLRFDVKSGQLLVEVEPSDAAASLLRNGRKVLVEIDGRGQLWNMSIPQSFWNSNRSKATRVFRGRLLSRNVDAQSLVPVFLNVRTNAFALTGEGMVDGRPVEVHFQMSADGAQVSLSGRIGKGKSAENFNVLAATLVELRTQNPQHVTRYLVPLLRELSGENPLRPRAGEVYRVFDHIVADPAVTGQLLAILSDLGSPDPAARESADQRLRDLGPPGVLAALRLDRSALSPEQSVRLDNLIAEHSFGYDLDPAAALQDRQFLQDATEDPDPAVRSAAKDQLQELQASQGH